MTDTPSLSSLFPLSLIAPPQPLLRTSESESPRQERQNSSEVPERLAIKENLNYLTKFPEFIKTYFSLALHEKSKFLLYDQ